TTRGEAGTLRSNSKALRGRRGRDQSVREGERGWLWTQGARKLVGAKVVFTPEKARRPDDIAGGSARYASARTQFMAVNRKTNPWTKGILDCLSGASSGSVEYGRSRQGIRAVMKACPCRNFWFQFAAIWRSQYS